jgi:molybdopterin converting factor small subunit
MKIVLQTFGDLEDLIKDRKFVFPDDQMPLGSFFNFLKERYHPEVREHLLPGGKFTYHYSIFINGINILRLKNLDTKLIDGDRIFIITLADGG